MKRILTLLNLLCISQFAYAANGNAIHSSPVIWSSTNTARLLVPTLNFVSSGTLNGSTSANGNLTLESTSNSTKGSIFINPHSTGSVLIATSSLASSNPKLQIGDFVTTSDLLGANPPKVVSTNDRSTDTVTASQFANAFIEYPNFGATTSTSTYTAGIGYAYNDVAGSVAQDYRGWVGSAEVASGANSTFLIGNQGSVKAFNGSVATNAWANYGLVTSSGASSSIVTGQGLRGVVTASSSGAITTAQALYGTVTTSGGGSITTGYGLYLDTITATTKYSLWVNDSTAPAVFLPQVGIGAAPSSSFGAIMLQLTSNNGSGIPSGMLVNGYGSNGTGVFFNSSGGTLASPTHVSNGDTVGNLQFLAYGDTAGTNGASTAQLLVVAKANYTDANKPSEVQFWNTPSGTGTSQQTLTLLSTGVVRADRGDVVIATAGKGLQVKEGSNARMGTSTMVAGTVTVANTSVTASTRIFLTKQDCANTAAVRQASRVAATSFTITSADGADTCAVAWLLVEPSP